MESEIAKEIFKITDWFSTKEIKEISGEDLSRAIFRLSVLRVNLGQELAVAVGDYDLAYLSRKVQYAVEWNRQKDELTQKLTVRDMDSNALLAIREEQEKELEFKRYADNLKFLYDSSGTLITTIQSRLRQLDNDKKETAYYKQNNYNK